MVEQSELTRLVRRLESHDLRSEGVDEPVGKSAVQVSFEVEQTYALGGLACLDNQLDRASVEPSPALVNQLAYGIHPKGAAMLLAQFELDFETALTSHRDHLGSRQRHIGESLATLDSVNADIGAKVQVGRQLSLRDGYLERAPTSN